MREEVRAADGETTTSSREAHRHGRCGHRCAAAGLAFIMMRPLPTTPAAQASTVRAGDHRLPPRAGGSTDLNAVPAIVAEMGSSKLRARWTRLLVHWAALQPVSPGKPSSSATRTVTATPTPTSPSSTSSPSELHDAGISVIMTPLDTPKWASDRSWWKTPPPGFKKGVYYPFYAPDMKSITVTAQFQKIGTFLAQAVRRQGQVLRSLERAQPGHVPLPAGPGQRHERRGQHLPQDAQGVARGRQGRRARRRRHRRRDVAAGER